MIKSGSRFPDGKPDVDKAKRIYRAAVETVRRLDDIPCKKKAYRDVFRQDAVGLRTRLKEYCERLMFYDPALYGRKAEEVLWRKVFYDIIQLVKHNRRHIHPHSSVENAFRTHLAAATGYYYHLLFRLQQEFNLHFDGILDFYLLPPSTPGNKYQNHRRKEGDKAIKEWATKACHRCLVYLGDIARYQQSFDEGFSCVTAERYYYQALALFPEMGMPHNQLGTMSGSRHYSCDAAYHYIRCLVSELSFEGATGNLDRLFEKISKRFHELTVTTPRDLPPHQQRQRDVRRFLVRFMYLLNIFFKSPESIGNYEIQEQCQLTLQDFDLCMFYEMSGDSEDGTEHKPTYLDDDIIFRIVIMCMAAIYYQQKNGSRQVAASIAFLLALVSHVLNHVICRLQRALQEAENPVQLPQVDAEEFQLGSGNVKSFADESSTQNGIQDKTRENKTESSKQQQKKRKMNRLRSLRRRRHRDDSDSSEGSCDDSLDDSDLSEGEGGEGSEDGLSLSDDSDDFIDCIPQDSDSDFEDNLNKLDRNSAESNGLSPSKSISTTDSLKSSSRDSLINENTDSSSSMGGASDGSATGEEPINVSNVWNKQGVDDNLILLSSELFTNSSSTPILGQSHRHILTSLDSNTHPPAVDGISRVTNTHKRNDSAELAQKLASFVIETDTETVMPTDAEMSPVQSDSDVENAEEEDRDQEKDKQQHLAMLLEIVHSEKLLPVVKVACDWMKCHSHVITTCAQSSQSLWSRLAVLLNFLPNKDQIMQVCPGHVSPNLKAVLGASGENRWQQCFPLVEDISLQCFVPLQEIHATVDFSLWSQAVVKEDVENLLRVACLRQFGHYLSSLNGVEFFYQPLEKEFLGPAQTHRSPAEKVHQDKLVTAETRRNQLMRDMAQLRLQAEVTELEGSLQSVDTPSFPPYLLSDTQVLCENLPVFKHLTQTARCIIIIPLSVIDSLDLMKKESSAARETIRWLEVELRKGNRYIRAQKAKERAGPTSRRNLKKENRDVWCVHELLACGLYLSQQTDQLVNHSMVTVLTTHNLHSLENMARLKALLKACKQQGISIEKMEDFQKRWKHLWEGKG